MNNNDITKLADRLTQSLATKEDIKGLKDDISGVKSDIKRLEDKTDKILQFQKKLMK